jgi:hypothetical protein
MTHDTEIIPFKNKDGVKRWFLYLNNTSDLLVMAIQRYSVKVKEKDTSTNQRFLEGVKINLWRFLIDFQRPLFRNEYCWRFRGGWPLCSVRLWACEHDIPDNWTLYSGWNWPSLVLTMLKLCPAPLNLCLLNLWWSYPDEMKWSTTSESPVTPQRARCAVCAPWKMEAGVDIVPRAVAKAF